MAQLVNTQSRGATGFAREDGAINPAHGRSLPVGSTAGEVRGEPVRSGSFTAIGAGWGSWFRSSEARPERAGDAAISNVAGALPAGATACRPERERAIPLCGADGGVSERPRLNTGVFHRACAGDMSARLPRACPRRTRSRPAGRTRAPGADDRLSRSRARPLDSGSERQLLASCVGRTARADLVVDRGSAV